MYSPIIYCIGHYLHVIDISVLCIFHCSTIKQNFQSLYYNMYLHTVTIVLSIHGSMCNIGVYHQKLFGVTFSNLRVHAHFRLESGGRKGRVTVVPIAPIFQYSFPLYPSREILDEEVVFTEPMVTV